MMTLLVFKERIKSFYQKYEMYISPLIKFIYSLIILCVINANIGYNDTLKKLPILLAIALVCAFVPSSVFVLIFGAISLAHVYAASKELALVVLIVYIVLYSLFIRFAPNMGYFIMAVPIMYVFGVPYTIPLLAGLIYAPIAIIPASCGVMIYYLFQIIRNNYTIIIDTSGEEIIQTYIYLVNEICFNRLMILTFVVFTLVIVATYFVGRMSIDHSWDIAIVTGATVNILVFLIGDLILDISSNLVYMIIGTLISVVIVFITQFFRITVDYTRTEKVQFEDDEYYYYVKAVPKINVTTSEINVKRINTRRGEHRFSNSIKNTNNTDDEM